MFVSLNILYIYANITLLFVIVKRNRPRALLEEEEVQFVQVHVDQEVLHGEIFCDRANDHMEADNDANNTIEEDGTNRFIYETFNNVGIYDDGSQFDDAYDIPVLHRESEPIYEGLNISLLSALFMLLNLKVVNGMSNTRVTQVLTYVIY